MLTKSVAILMTAVFAALALEVVFGVRLGITAWLHAAVGTDGFSLLPHS
jgi:hypothetical protein